MQHKIEEIWIDLNEELFYFILLKVKEEEVAKDILQEVFIKIQTSASTTIKTYFLGVSNNS